MKKISGILILVALLGSCKSNSTDNNPDNPLAGPKTGSIFIFDNYYIDTAGNKVVTPPNVESIDTVTVLSTGLDYEGRKNNTNFHSTGNIGSLILNYESSGDVSFFSPQRLRDAFMLHAGRLILPVSTLSSTMFVYLDSVVKINGKPDQHGYEKETLTYIGTKDMQVGSEKLSCVKIQDINYRDYGQMDYTGLDTTILWFSKKLGYIAKAEPATMAIHLGPNRDEIRGVSILLGYTLK